MQYPLLSVRGKYAQEYQQGSGQVLIGPDLREAFPDSTAVNKALREYLALRKAALRDK